MNWKRLTANPHAVRCNRQREIQAMPLATDKPARLIIEACLCWAILCAIAWFVLML